MIDVGAMGTQIFQAACELVFEKTWRHAMAAGGDVFGRENSLVNVFLEEIPVGVGGHGAVGRKVAAFCAHEDFVARKSFVPEDLQSGADASFTALQAVIDSRIDHVDSGFHGGDDGGGVAGVG